MADNSGPNKRLNGPDGRVRNTSTSNQSRNPGARKPPSVPGLGEGYGSAAGIATGMAGAWQALQDTLGAMRSQRVGLRAKFKTDRANIRSEAVGFMSEAINQGIETGMTGSSATNQSRIGVIAQRRADIEAAHAEMKEGVLQTKIAETQAIGQYETAVAGYEMQAAALRQQQAIADAQLAAQREGNANMLAFMESQMNPVPGTIRGREIVTLPNGNYKVAGMEFTAGTPAAVIEQAIIAQNQARITRLRPPNALGFVRGQR